MRPTGSTRSAPVAPRRNTSSSRANLAIQRAANRNRPSLLPDLKLLFQKALSEKVTVKQGDREHTLTMAEAGIKQLVAQYAKGDRHARRDVVIYAEKLGIDLIAAHRNTIKQAHAADRQAILDAYFEHRTQVTELCKSSPVLAPPELLDDDAEDST